MAHGDDMTSTAINFLPFSISDIDPAKNGIVTDIESGGESQKRSAMTLTFFLNFGGKCCTFSRPAAHSGLIPGVRPQ